MANPPVIPVGGGVYRIGDDSAKYTIPPNWFEHPSLSVPGGATFVWPLGIEGFRLTGTAQLGIHRYIGENEVVVQVTHASESRIEMSGEFPGKTGVVNMRALRDVIEAKTPEDGKLLRLPGVFPLTQYVVIENWDFNHAEDDRTETVLYTVTFVKTGVGKRVKRRKEITPPPNPKRRANRGNGSQVFRVRDGARTLRKIAQLVYGGSNQWTHLYTLNTQTLNRLNIPLHQLPTRLLPIGLRLNY